MNEWEALEQIVMELKAIEKRLDDLNQTLIKALL
jgi:uncharacterized protein Yka (UPF0111/DUF47 family)